MPQRQWLPANINDGPSGSVTQYINICGTGEQTTWTSTEADVLYCVPTAGTFLGFYLNRATGPGAGSSSSYRLRVNNADSSSFTASVSNTNTTIRAPFIRQAVVAGDRVCLAHYPTLSPAASAPQSWSTFFCPANPAESVWLCNSGNSSLSSTTTYLSIGGQAQQSGTEADVTCVATQVTGGTAFGTLTKFFVHLSVAPGGVTASRTFNVRVNGTDYFTVTITGTNVSGNATGTVTINDGDTISIKSTGANSPALAKAYFGICLEPTIAGDYLIPSSANDLLRTTVGDEYHNIAVGGWTWSNTATERAQIPLWGIIHKGIGARVTAAPGVGKERAFRLAPYNTPSLTSVISGTATYAKSSLNYQSLTPDYASNYGIVHRCIFASPTAANGKWSTQYRSFFPLSPNGLAFGC